VHRGRQPRGGISCGPCSRGLTTPRKLTQAILAALVELLDAVEGM
jgi:hypothetical protein